MDRTHNRFLFPGFLPTDNQAVRRARLRNPMQIAATLWVITLGVLLTPVAGAALDEAEIESACAKLQRSNIDCSCVGRRIASISRKVPYERADELLLETYRYNLGQANSALTLFGELNADPEELIRAELAFDEAGGRPGSIDEYESGCVIAGSALPALPELPDEPATRSYVQKCTAATSDARYCQCSAATVRQRTNSESFEVYLRSFSDYSDTRALTLDEMTASRAAAMGITPERFTELRARVARILDEHGDRDAQYCAALLWADSEPGASEAQREAVARAKTTSANETIGPAESLYPRAQKMLATTCAADGFSTGYCHCYLQNIEKQIFSQLESESTALAYALMQGGEGLSPMESMTVLSQLSSEEQMAIGIMAGSVDAGKDCPR